MVALWGHMIRYLRRGKALVVMAVLAPAVLTLAMGSLALLRPAPVAPPTAPSATTVAVTQVDESVPTPASHRRTAPTVTSGKSRHRTGEPRGIH